MGTHVGACGVDTLALLKSLQAVHSVHDALKFGAVDQVESVLFPGEHFERYAASSRDHPGSFLSGKIAAGDRFNREMNQNSKTSNAPAFVVYFFLRGSPGFSVVHDGLKTAENQYELREWRAQ